MKNHYTIKNIGRLVILIAMVLTSSCRDYLDVVPEGTATLESAFTMRQHTMRYLYTCYSYLPTNRLGASLDIMGSDEVWVNDDPNNDIGIPRSASLIPRGLLTPSNDIMGKWSTYYTAIRDCNSFLEGIETYIVPDLPEYEREQWIAEVKVLKAYYHFLLMRQYGPIPIVKKNLPVSTDVAGVQVKRNTIDEVVNYIVELFDQAIPSLPASVRSEATDLGRLTLPIAVALKAQIMVTAASPLFNYNTEFAVMVNRDGTQLFPQDESQRAKKWQQAVDACREAIRVCVDSLGMKLYTYPGDPRYNLTDTIMQQMTLRNAFYEEWNNEVIWAETRGWVNALQNATLPVLNPLYQEQAGMHQSFSIPLQIAEMFYTENGVPIQEDNEWDYSTRYTLRRGTAEEGLYIRNGGETVRSNFEREPRFYAWLGFPQGIWYGSGQYDDSRASNLYSYPDIRGFRLTGPDASAREPTGYVPKKWIHHQTLQPVTSQISINNYIWPKYRLAELLLYYAEALNEADNSQAARQEAMKYADMVRERAGLEPIADAWGAHSNRPTKYTTQEGFREIIQQERLIELCFEGSRFWDLRRWKTAREVLNQPIQGWSVFNTDNVDIYKPRVIQNQRFGLKDYFWPIAESELTRNVNLVQSLGW